MSRKKQTLRERTQWVALCGLLVALMLVLGFVESLMPVAAGVLMVLKVVLSGLLFGGVNAMMYAFAGGLVSMVFMALLSRVRGVHPVMVSMVGGVAHNVGQVALAMVILSTPSLMYYMAVLMVAGLITGAVTGLAANLVMKHLAKIRR